MLQLSKEQTKSASMEQDLVCLEQEIQRLRARKSSLEIEVAEVRRLSAEKALEESVSGRLETSEDSSPRLGGKEEGKTLKSKPPRAPSSEGKVT